jgi:Fe-S cluster assembly protein SufB
MAEDNKLLESLTQSEYKYGFVTDIEHESLAPGLTEETVRFISATKNEPEWLLEWRLNAYRHWLTLTTPTWQNVKFPVINYQDIIFYSAPKQKVKLNSLDEVDPELRKTYEKRLRVIRVKKISFFRRRR